MPEPWMEFFAPKLNRSVYFGAHDPANRPLVLRLELIPSNSATVREDGNWPRPSELKGQPVGRERVLRRLCQRAGRQDLRSRARADLVPRRRLARGEEDLQEMEGRQVGTISSAMHLSVYQTQGAIR